MGCPSRRSAVGAVAAWLRPDDRMFLKFKVAEVAAYRQMSKRSRRCRVGACTFVGTLMVGFDRYLSTGGGDLGADRVGYQQTPMWLTDEEFDEMAAQMEAIFRSGYDNPPDSGRKRRLFSTIVFPDRAD